MGAMLESKLCRNSNGSSPAWEKPAFTGSGSRSSGSLLWILAWESPLTSAAPRTTGALVMELAKAWS